MLERLGLVFRLGGRVVPGRQFFRGKVVGTSRGNYVPSYYSDDGNCYKPYYSTEFSLNPTIVRFKQMPAEEKEKQHKEEFKNLRLMLFEKDEVMKKMQAQMEEMQRQLTILSNTYRIEIVPKDSEN